MSQAHAGMVQDDLGMRCALKRCLGRDGPAHFGNRQPRTESLLARLKTLARSSEVFQQPLFNSLFELTDQWRWLKGNPIA